MQVFSSGEEQGLLSSFRAQASHLVASLVRSMDSRALQLQ